MERSSPWGLHYFSDFRVFSYSSHFTFFFWSSLIICCSWSSPERFSLLGIRGAASAVGQEHGNQRYLRRKRFTTNNKTRPSSAHYNVWNKSLKSAEDPLSLPARTVCVEATTKAGMGPVDVCTSLLHIADATKCNPIYWMPSYHKWVQCHGAPDGRLRAIIKISFVCD